MTPHVCPVCTQPYANAAPRRPQALDCGHTFCASCCVARQVGDVVTCPACKHKTSRGLAGLPVIFALISNEPPTPPQDLVRLVLVSVLGVTALVLVVLLVVLHQFDSELLQEPLATLQQNPQLAVVVALLLLVGRGQLQFSLMMDPINEELRLLQQEARQALLMIQQHQNVQQP